MKTVKIILPIIMAVCINALAESADTAVNISSHIDTTLSADTAVIDAANAVSADTSDSAGNIDNIDNTEEIGLANKSNGIDDLDDILDNYEFGLADINIDSLPPQAKPNLYSREYNHRGQIRLAVVMMTFIAVAFTTAQSWNPR